MRNGPSPAGLMDAACGDLQAAGALVARAGADDIAASRGPLTRAMQRLEAALAVLAAEPASGRAGAGGALERFRRELSICTALYEHLGAFCAEWLCARSGPGAQSYSPRGGAFALPVRAGRRVSLEG